jgi:hypothetical protein
MLSHLPLLMGSYAHVAPRHGTTKQNKPCLLILRVVGVRMVMIHDTLKKTPGTRQASALVADSRQKNIVCRGRIPDELVLSAVKPSWSPGSFELNLKASFPNHGL